MDAVGNCLQGFDQKGGIVLIPIFLTCSECDGTGEEESGCSCSSCKGKGRVLNKRNAEILDSWFDARYEEAKAEVEAEKAADDALDT